MKLDNIEIVREHKIFQIREKTENGGFHRRLLTPDKDISSEVEEIQEKAEELWTNEVKEKWAAHLEKTTPKE